MSKAGRRRSTPDEATVWQLIAKGFTDKEISIILKMSTSSVHKRVRALLSEKAVTNRIELALLYHGIEI